jgi:hypothetical protein
MVSSLPDVGVFILGTDSSLRNPDLKQVHPNITYVPPVFLSHQEGPNFRQRLFEFLLNGRVLTRGERGCTLAHINIRHAILKSTFEWNLVLEDDVSLPGDWLVQILDQLQFELNSADPFVLILNTNPHFDFGLQPRKLRLKPSSANAFLIHRRVIEAAKHRELERFELADWPTSFADAEFWTMSGLAMELDIESLIGHRPIRRTLFVFSAILRGLLSPILAKILHLPFRVYFGWSILGPVHRDLVLRARNFGLK